MSKVLVQNLASGRIRTTRLTVAETKCAPIVVTQGGKKSSHYAGYRRITNSDADKKLVAAEKEAVRLERILGSKHADIYRRARLHVIEKIKMTPQSFMRNIREMQDEEGEVSVNDLERVAALEFGMNTFKPAQAELGKIKGFLRASGAKSRSLVKIGSRQARLNAIKEERRQQILAEREVDAEYAAGEGAPLGDAKAVADLKTREEALAAREAALDAAEAKAAKGKGKPKPTGDA